MLVSKYRTGKQNIGIAGMMDQFRTRADDIATLHLTTSKGSSQHSNLLVCRTFELLCLLGQANFLQHKPIKQGKSK